MKCEAKKNLILSSSYAKASDGQRRSGFAAPVSCGGFAPPVGAVARLVRTNSSILHYQHKTRLLGGFCFQGRNRVYLIASLRVFEARNFGTFIAFISIVAPVRGLRPMPPARGFASKMPRPAIETSSPFLRQAVMVSMTASTARSPSAFVQLMVAATFSTKSILFAILF